MQLIWFCLGALISHQMSLKLLIVTFFNVGNLFKWLFMVYICDDVSFSYSFFPNKQL